MDVFKVCVTLLQPTQGGMDTDLGNVCVHHPHPFRLDACELSDLFTVGVIKRYVYGRI